MPNLGNVGTILRLRTTWVGMLVLSAGLVGWQGVYAILPAYLVSHALGTEQYVNTLLTLSRVASVVMLVAAGFSIRRGFVCMSGYMVLAIAALAATPAFGREEVRG